MGTLPFTKRSLQRAIEAAQAARLEHFEVEIRSDGTVFVRTLPREADDGRLGPRTVETYRTKLRPPIDREKAMARVQAILDRSKK